VDAVFKPVNPANYGFSGSRLPGASQATKRAFAGRESERLLARGVPKPWFYLQIGLIQGCERSIGTPHPSMTSPQGALGWSAFRAEAIG
jgi:hypothetical protein